ncbi:hypothetical protein OIU78_018032 [Salix suchowensis]|nr:hypothetical protein OIU78_018032 [Salix suchowensis]
MELDFYGFSEGFSCSPGNLCPQVFHFIFFSNSLGRGDSNLAFSLENMLVLCIYTGRQLKVGSLRPSRNVYPVLTKKQARDGAR